MTEPKLRKRLEQFNGGSVDDLYDWCVHRGIDPATVTLTACHIKWKSPETDVERAHADLYARQNLARKEQWERETYERLKAQFESEESDS